MKFANLRFFIVEDEKESIKALTESLENIDSVELLGHADNVEDAYSSILELKPDALFLDIKLRGGDAFHLMKKFKTNGVVCPPAIIMTGHDEFELAQKAINNYHSNILKILKKPFWEDFDRHFEECRDAILAYRQFNHHKKDEVLYVKDGNFTYRIAYDEIDYISVGGSGTIYLMISDKLEESKKINQTLNSFLEGMPDKFIRIHRNFAIHIDKISHIDHEEHVLYLKGHDKGLSIGRTYYPIITRMTSTG